MQLLGACLKPPNICIIYEFVSGGPLHQRIHGRNQPPLEYLEVLELSRDIAEGLVRPRPALLRCIALLIRVVVSCVLLNSMS